MPAPLAVYRSSPLVRALAWSAVGIFAAGKLAWWLLVRSGAVVP